jgi:hypothetical protein
MHLVAGVAEIEGRAEAAGGTSEIAGAWAKRCTKDTCEYGRTKQDNVRCEMRRVRQHRLIPAIKHPATSLHATAITPVDAAQSNPKLADKPSAARCTDVQHGV